MGKSIMFTESVLEKDIIDTKEILNYLKEKKYELIAVTDKIMGFQKEQLQRQEIFTYFDILIPDITLKSMDWMFFDNMKKDIIARKTKQNSLLIRSYDALLIDWSTYVVVTDNIEVCKEANSGGFKDIYYDDGKENIVGGHKIKKLGALKYIY